MSPLPRAASARLDDAKIRQYLLSASHSPQAAAKERFFTNFGFSASNWDELKNALLQHPLTNPVASRTTNAHGRKYAVSCSLRSPDRRNPCVVSVWIIEPPDPNPKFVTAYPGP
jgi:hypothetical protein